MRTETRQVRKGEEALFRAASLVSQKPPRWVGVSPRDDPLLGQRIHVRPWCERFRCQGGATRPVRAGRRGFREAFPAGESAPQTRRGGEGCWGPSAPAPAAVFPLPAVEAEQMRPGGEVRASGVGLGSVGAETWGCSVKLHPTLNLSPVCWLRLRHK